MSVRDLRNNTSGVIAALEDGEGVVLTSRGREVGEIRPIGPKRRLVPAAELFAGPGDDPQLRADTAALRDATVDDIEDAGRGWLTRPGTTRVRSPPDCGSRS